MLEIFARKIIDLHGFSSNSKMGFSCYIPDSKQYSQNEGLLIWNYSNAYKRFETQIQKFSAKARINRMEEMLSLNYDEYKLEMMNRIYNFKSTLLSISEFQEIGNGTNVFDKTKIRNVGANFQYLLYNLESLKKFEIWTINNPIVKFAEKMGYFKCQNTNKLAWDELLSNSS